MKAELIINGPRGQAYVEIYIEPDAIDGKLHPAYIEAAAAQALNIYNELPQPYSVISFGKDDFDINPDRHDRNKKHREGLICEFSGCEECAARKRTLQITLEA